jgi:hypothetical protein
MVIGLVFFTAVITHVIPILLRRFECLYQIIAEEAT